jgi:hypothetical protein
MIRLLKIRIQLFGGGLSQHEQSRVDAENEHLAMSCGSFNPRFLAKVTRCQADNLREIEQHKTGANL